MMQNLEPVPQEMWPYRVLVYGDINSTLAVALVAAKLHIPIAHVEASLYSFSRAVPGEINRIVSEQLSGILFASTRAAVDKLLDDEVADERVFPVEDAMYDAGMKFAVIAAQRSELLSRLGGEPKRYVLATRSIARRIPTIRPSWPISFPPLKRLWRGFL